MLDLTDLLEHLNSGRTILADSPENHLMHQVSLDTQAKLSQLNATYREDEAMGRAVTDLAGREPVPGLRIRQPFYTDFGHNIHFGHNVFINSACHFQDQGGIKIGNKVFIGHQVVLASLDHDLNPRKRGNLHPGSIVIEDNVWIGSQVTILKGVTIGQGSVIAAGSVVNQDVEPGTIVGGNPAKEIRKIDR